MAHVYVNVFEPLFSSSSIRRLVALGGAIGHMYNIYRYSDLTKNMILLNLEKKSSHLVHCIGTVLSFDRWMCPIVGLMMTKGGANSNGGQEVAMELK